MDGTRCYFESVDALSLRAIDLTYFYTLETASTKEEDVLASLEAIERSFVIYVCGIDRRRSLEDTNTTVKESQVYDIVSTDPKVVAVDSNPLDTISADCKYLSFSSRGMLTYSLMPFWCLL
jgi:hypothetical protein